MENLEWATESEQIIHAIKNRLNPRDGRRVTCINTNKEMNILEASKIYGCSAQHMGNMLKGKKRNTSTYLFK